MCIMTKMVNLSVKLGKLKLNNPVLVASGTFGCGEEFKDLVDLSKLGAIITKTITSAPCQGNPMPRTIETPCGLLNSIGLQNEGIDDFIKNRIPFLTKLPTPVVVSIMGESTEEFQRLAKIVNRQDAIDAIELNISCPNIKSHLRRQAPHVKNLKPETCDSLQLIAQDPQSTYRVVKAVRKNTKKTLITKLSPNVTDIVQIAQAAQEAGSDALSLINTVYGMSIDLNRRRPHLASIFGGLSGPAIKPITLYMIYKVAKRIKLPIIGMGGIMTAQDALEFILAGATAVAVGTANFVNPRVSIEIIQGIKQYLIKNKIKDIKNLIGTLKI